MLTIKKITDKSLSKVVGKDIQPCRYSVDPGFYNCLYDCTTSGKPRYYKSKDF